MRGYKPILPRRLRRIPPQFSWLDHRLMRHGHIRGRSAGALALYLVLVTVADAEGLSWYGELTLAQALSCDVAQLRRDRAELEAANLIAYRKPLYQVLSLETESGACRPVLEAQRAGEALPLGEIIKNLLGGTQ